MSLACQYSLILFYMSFVGHPYVLACELYVIRISLASHPYATCMYSYVIRMSLVCHPYVTRMYSYVIRMSFECTRMSLLRTRMSSVSSSEVLPWTGWTFNFVNRIIVTGYIKSFVPGGTLFYRFVKKSSFELYCFELSFYIHCWDKLSGNFSQNSGWNKYLPQNKKINIEDVLSASLGDFKCSWCNFYISPWQGENFAWFPWKFFNIGHKTWFYHSFLNKFWFARASS